MIDIPANWMEKIQNIDWSKVEASVKDYGPAIKVLQQTWSKESLLEISQGKLFVPDSVINEAIAKKIPEGGSVTGVTLTSHANGRLDIRAETKKVGPVELSGEIQEFVHNGGHVEVSEDLPISIRHNTVTVDYSKVLAESDFGKTEYQGHRLMDMLEIEGAKPKDGGIEFDTKLNVPDDVKKALMAVLVDQMD